MIIANNEYIIHYTRKSKPSVFITTVDAPNAEMAVDKLMSRLKAKSEVEIVEIEEAIIQFREDGE
jgi:hypothetical protein